MEKLLKELKKLVPFKETTDVGDLVLVVFEENEMAGYALVTGIEPDRARKDEWWEVHMQLLSVPPQPLVWTLRTEQFTGQETFTMGGKGRFVQAVHFETEVKKAGSLSLSETEVGTEKKGGLRLIK
ncbi:ATPase [Candidatus Electrothrix laxa]